MTKPESLETKIKQHLSQSENTLEQTTQQRLNKARQIALQQSQQPALSSWLDDILNWFKQPAGNMVMASVLAIALLLPQLGNQHQPHTSQEMHQTALLDLIDVTDEESLDETADPDFYLWLAEVDGQHA